MRMRTMTPEALRQNTALKEIDLRRNNIGDEGAKALAEANEQMPMCHRPFSIGPLKLNKKYRRNVLYISFLDSNIIFIVALELSIGSPGSGARALRYRYRYDMYRYV